MYVRYELFRKELVYLVHRIRLVNDRPTKRVHNHERHFLVLPTRLRNHLFKNFIPKIPHPTLSNFAY